MVVAELVNFRAVTELEPVRSWCSVFRNKRHLPTPLFLRDEKMFRFGRQEYRVLARLRMDIIICTYLTKDFIPLPLQLNVDGPLGEITFNYMYSRNHTHDVGIFNVCTTPYGWDTLNSLIQWNSIFLDLNYLTWMVQAGSPRPPRRGKPVRGCVLLAMPTSLEYHT